jgi:hypothetical protein
LVDHIRLHHTKVRLKSHATLYRDQQLAGKARRREKKNENVFSYEKNSLFGNSTTFYI